jgi:hypothetical protein
VNAAGSHPADVAPDRRSRTSAFVSITDFIGRLRKPEPPAGIPAGPSPQATATKAFPRFLAALQTVEEPVLLDLGSVVGSNVTFFGEQLGCKIFVEDLASDIDRHVRESRPGDLPEFLERRFPRDADSVDGIICWDLFDYLERPAGEALARQLAHRLRPNGVLLAFFHQATASAAPAATYTRHIVVDQRTLEQRSYAAARGKLRPLLNRDIQRMFEPLAITDQFLLKSNVREVVFRKPAS